MIVPRLRAAYDLTEEEALMAFFLYSGNKLTEIVSVTGTPLYDAQLTVDRLMRKMDARRYADVVRRVAHFTGAV